MRTDRTSEKRQKKKEKWSSLDSDRETVFLFPWLCHESREREKREQKEEGTRGWRLIFSLTVLLTQHEGCFSHEWILVLPIPLCHDWSPLEEEEEDTVRKKVWEEDRARRKVTRDVAIFHSVTPVISLSISSDIRSSVLWYISLSVRETWFLEEKRESRRVRQKDFSCLFKVSPKKEARQEASQRSDVWNQNVLSFLERQEKCFT